MSQLFNENFKSYRERQDILAYDDHIEVNQMLYQMSKSSNQDTKQKYSQMIMSILSKYEPTKSIDPRTGLSKPQEGDELGGGATVSSRYQPSKDEQNKKHYN